MADDETTAPETVSREAHERRVAEIEELKAQNKALQQAVSGTALRDKIYDHYRQTPGIDAFGLARLAVDSAAVRQAADSDNFTEVLDQWRSQTEGLFRSATEVPPEGETEERPVEETPVGLMNPNPGAAGAQAGQQQVSIRTLREKYGDEFSPQATEERRAAQEAGTWVSVAEQAGAILQLPE